MRKAKIAIGVVFFVAIGAFLLSWPQKPSKYPKNIITTPSIDQQKTIQYKPNIPIRHRQEVEDKQILLAENLSPR